MTTHDDSSPAFPLGTFYPHPTDSGVSIMHGHPGMSLRQYAAIKLRVPDSGLAWLDEMILASRRAEYAGLAMQGLLANPAVMGSKDKIPISVEAMISGTALLMADALIEELKK